MIWQESDAGTRALIEELTPVGAVSALMLIEAEVDEEARIDALAQWLSAFSDVAADFQMIATHFLGLIRLRREVEGALLAIVERNPAAQRRRGDRVITLDITPEGDGDAVRVQGLIDDERVCPACGVSLGDERADCTIQNPEVLNDPANIGGAINIDMCEDCSGASKARTVGQV